MQLEKSSDLLSRLACPMAQQIDVTVPESVTIPEGIAQLHQAEKAAQPKPRYACRSCTALL